MDCSVPGRLASRLTGGGQALRVAQPLTLADSEPRPDIAVVIGTRDDFRTTHPQTAELVIEVAVTTEEIDRARIAINSEAQIDECWLVLRNNVRSWSIEIQILKSVSMRTWRLSTRLMKCHGLAWTCPAASCSLKNGRPEPTSATCGKPGRLV